MNDIAPKFKQWIVAVDTDSFNYEPALASIAKCRKAKIKGFRKKSTAQKHCDKLNSF